MSFKYNWPIKNLGSLRFSRKLERGEKVLKQKFWIRNFSSCFRLCVEMNDIVRIMKHALYPICGQKSFWETLKISNQTDAKQRIHYNPPSSSKPSLSGALSLSSRRRQSIAVLQHKSRGWAWASSSVPPSDLEWSRRCQKLKMHLQRGKI